MDVESAVSSRIKTEGGSGTESSPKMDIGLKDLQFKLAEFARVRDWDQFHSPRNLLLALVGEVGELSEIFQWKGEVERGLPNWNTSEKEHLGDELSDVLLYLVRLADICGVDLGEAAMRKLTKNGVKYPVERCKISSYIYAQTQKQQKLVNAEWVTTQLGLHDN